VWSRKKKESKMSKKTKSSKKVNKVQASTTLVPTEVSSFVDEKIVMAQHDVDRVKTLDADVRNAKLQLADIQLQLFELDTKQIELINSIKATANSMMQLIHEIAAANGIDTSVNSNKKWNLDTNDMTFYRIA
jgi:hypothetical protein